MTTSADATLLRIALSMTKGVDATVIRRMQDCDITPEDFFALDAAELAARLGLNRPFLFSDMERGEALERARGQIQLVERHGVRVLFLGEEGYPMRLAECADAPVTLYQLGSADLNSRNPVSVVGTRKPSPYGMSFTREMVAALAPIVPGLTIVSGLAFGIDAASHRASLESGVPTVAVVAHGLQMIYPSAHRGLARDILSAGGAIVTEYPFGSPPYRQRFLERNRLIAGMADVTVVVESAMKGGARSTAASAASYGRDVYALPGRVNDPLSEGCNRLIADGGAMLLQSPAGLLDSLDVDINLHPEGVQKSMFPELDPEAEKVIEALRGAERPLTADQLCRLASVGAGTLMQLIGELEDEGLVYRHPGNRFSAAGY